MVQDEHKQKHCEDFQHLVHMILKWQNGVFSQGQHKNNDFVDMEEEKNE